MQLWPAWLGGTALAVVALGHWLLLGRQMAVSGRFSAIVNRLRHGEPEAPIAATDALDADDVVEALRAMTADEFGDEGGPSETPDPPDVAAALERLGTRHSMGLHWLFLGGLALGGLVSVWLGGFEGPGGLATGTFHALFGNTPWEGRFVLLAGGALVGFGTRMAAGCTSGHGLCGVSRVQKGSLVSTCSFFGAGVATSFLLGAAL